MFDGLLENPSKLLQMLKMYKSRLLSILDYGHVTQTL